jgi:hypothetical protein
MHFSSTIKDVAHDEEVSLLRFHADQPEQAAQDTIAIGLHVVDVVRQRLHANIVRVLMSCASLEA